MPRPTKLTPEVQEAVCNALRAGSYADVAAEYAGIAPSTYYGWLARGKAEQERRQQPVDGTAVARREDRAARKREQPYVEFLEAVTRANATAEVRAVTIISAQAADDWRAALALLERRFPARWKQRNETALTGPEQGSPVAIVSATADSAEASRLAHDFLAAVGRREPHAPGE